MRGRRVGACVTYGPGSSPVKVIVIVAVVVLVVPIGSPVRKVACAVPLLRSLCGTTDNGSDQRQRPAHATQVPH
ncbi:hypothetical protein GCM10010496_11440 [Streptomyces asoensis]|nr:hypothetical protein GCM10010496_11440 [Streptomyces asoensis]